MIFIIIRVSILKFLLLLFIVYSVDIARISVKRVVFLDSVLVHTIVVIAVGVHRFDGDLFSFGLELEAGGDAMGICLGKLQGSAIFARCTRG